MPPVSSPLPTRERPTTPAPLLEDSLSPGAPHRRTAQATMSKGIGETVMQPPAPLNLTLDQEAMEVAAGEVMVGMVAVMEGVGLVDPGDSGENNFIHFISF